MLGDQHIDYNDIAPGLSANAHFLFAQLSYKELKDVYIVYLEDGRRVEVPCVVYRHINDSAFRHGIEWARANKE